MIKKVEGITEIRDESDKKGMRIVIELRRGDMPDIVLNHLYKHTALQSSFGVNMVALEWATRNTWFTTFVRCLH